MYAVDVMMGLAVRSNRVFRGPLAYRYLCWPEAFYSYEEIRMHVETDDSQDRSEHRLDGSLTQCEAMVASALFGNLTEWLYLISARPRPGITRGRWTGLLCCILSTFQPLRGHNGPTASQHLVRRQQTHRLSV
jgi:hypothetical protein